MTLHWIALLGALGTVMLWLNEPSAYLVGACAWLGAALARVFSVIVDSNAQTKNLGGVVLEGVFGLALLSGHWLRRIHEQNNSQFQSAHLNHEREQECPGAWRDRSAGAAAALSFSS